MNPIALSVSSRCIVPAVRTLFICLYAILCCLLLSCSGDGFTDDSIKTVYYKGTDIVHQKISYKNKMKNGYFLEYSRTGVLRAKVFYRNDSLDDTTYLFHPNGKLRLIHVYKNKLRSGRWQEFNPEGKLYSELFFRNDKLDSVCSEYSYHSLKLQRRIRYKDGQKHGLEEEFYPDGSKKSTVRYNEGQVCVGTEEWDTKGNPINNDFSISVAIEDHAQNSDKRYVVTLQPSHADDRVCRAVSKIENGIIGYVAELTREGHRFYYDLNRRHSDNLMGKLTIVAYKRTAMGNLFAKTKTINIEEGV